LHILVYHEFPNTRIDTVAIFVLPETIIELRGGFYISEKHLTLYDL